MSKLETNNNKRFNKYQKLSTWEEQNAYRQGLLDAFCLLCDYLDDNFTDLIMSGNYNACDDMAHALRSYNSIINTIGTTWDN